jgi:hypothetical protein
VFFFSLAEAKRKGMTGEIRDEDELDRNMNRMSPHDVCCVSGNRYLRAKPTHGEVQALLANSATREVH